MLNVMEVHISHFVLYVFLFSANEGKEKRFKL